MTDRDRQNEADAAVLVQVLRSHQSPDSHATLTVKIQHGRIQLIEETKKHRPNGSVDNK